VQRAFVHESIYDEVKQKLVAHVKTLKKGDPLYASPLHLAPSAPS
jgi:acyl-CoA reductase-like NAD-dependent aldehyde dehydrogenase